MTKTRCASGAISARTIALLRHSMGLAMVALFLSLLTAPVRAAASVEEFRAMFKKMNDLQTKGEYQMALEVAKRFEAAARAKFGVGSAGHAEGMMNLASAYFNVGKYVEAAEMMKQSRAIYERKQGRDSAGVALINSNLVAALSNTGDLSGAEDAATRARVFFERTRNAQQTARSLDLLGMVYRLQGRFGEAEQNAAKSIATYEKVSPASSGLGLALNNLGNIYVSRNKLREADVVYQRGIAVLEKSNGPSHPYVATLLNNYGNLLRDQGRTDEAERFFRRSLSIYDKVSPDNPESASPLSNIGLLQIRAGAFEEAEASIGRAISIMRKARLQSVDLALKYDNIALAYIGSKKYDQAEGALKEGLAIRERVAGPKHAMVSLSLHLLGRLARMQGRLDVADSYLSRAGDIYLASYGESHAYTIVNEIEKAEVALARGEPDSAVTIMRRATALTVERQSLSRSAAEERSQEREIDSVYQVHVSALAAAVTRNVPSNEVAAEAIEVGQYANRTAAGSAMQQTAARFASGVGTLAELVREEQDLSGFVRARDKALVDALSKPEGERDQTLIDTTRRQIADARSRLRVLKVRIEVAFPDYAALSDPKPLKVGEIQQLLAADEALVFWLTTGKSSIDIPDPTPRRESYVFAVTREAAVWRTIPIDAKHIEAKVAEFRRGLDVEKFEAADGKDPGALFDLDIAHSTYSLLLGPVESLIKDKKSLLVVPSGALTAMPFHLLVADKPLPSSGPYDPSLYRNADWLFKRQAVTLLPAVGSLRSLRTLIRSEGGTKPLVGFADPQFRPDDDSGDKRSVAARSANRSFADFWQGAGIDRQKLSLSLPRLEDTADEIREVARRLGASMTNVHLRAAASETTVKKSDLTGFRIVYFATHGLVAGDVKGIAEPSLALSIPRTPTELDDGLLTASEVSQLKLNADWVVLSACNTIAGDKPGAEALSGLARAFFYAGARALLVSHWAVASDAATRLTTTTFEKLAADAGIGRAEALRRAMLEYLSDASNPRNAYPAYWAPFAIVGEGASRQASRN